MKHTKVFQLRSYLPKVKKDFSRFFLVYGLPGILALLIFFQRTKLWHWNFSIPLGYDGDGLLGLLYIQTILDEGWYLVNHALGAPGIFEFHDYVLSGDSFHMLMMKVLGWFWPNPFAVVNLFYILRFPATAIISTVALLEIGLTYWVSLAFGLIYTYIPYNMIRGQGHLHVGTFYILPLVILVILKAMKGSLQLSWKNRQFLAACLICAILAGSNMYNAFFGCSFLSLAGVYVYFSAKEKPVKKALTSFFLVGVVLVAELCLTIPLFLYQLKNGKNPIVGNRLAWEAELYGMKIIQLLMPIGNHVLGPFRRTAAAYAKNTPLISENILSSIGAVASLGFIFLIIWIFVSSSSGIQFKKIKKVLGFKEEDSETIWHLGLLNLWSVLLATIGGIGSMIAYFVLPGIRAYNRINIFIAFFALLAVALLIDRQIAKHIKTKGRKILIILALGVFTYGAILDQTGLQGGPPVAMLKEFETNQKFVSQIMATVPEKTMIFDLPFFTFPEHAPVHKIIDYEPIKMYLHSGKHLRWSYPTMLARPTSNWLHEVSSLPTVDFINRIYDKGFRGVYIDRFGYADNGESIESQIQEIVKTKPIYSDDGRRVFFPLKLNASIHYDKDEKNPESITIQNYQQPFSLPENIDRKKLLEKIRSQGGPTPITVHLDREDGIVDFDLIENSFIDHALPPAAFRSMIQCSPKEIHISPENSSVGVRISLKNNGSYWWPNKTAAGDTLHLIRIRSHLFGKKMTLLQPDFPSTVLFPHPIRPLEVFKTETQIEANLFPAGTTYLQYDLVQEGDHWAKDVGGVPCTIKITKE
jgi:phosphoglycerol transferase